VLPTERSPRRLQSSTSPLRKRFIQANIPLKAGNAPRARSRELTAPQIPKPSAWKLTILVSRQRSHDLAARVARAHRTMLAGDPSVTGMKICGNTWATLRTSPGCAPSRRRTVSRSEQEMRVPHRVLSGTAGNFAPLQRANCANAHARRHLRPAATGAILCHAIWPTSSRPSGIGITAKRRPHFRIRIRRRCAAVSIRRYRWHPLMVPSATGQGQCVALIDCGGYPWARSGYVISKKLGVLDALGRGRLSVDSWRPI